MSSIPSGSRSFARRKWLLVAAPAALFVACVSGDRIAGLKPEDRAARDESSAPGHVVISQVYGGGGNTGATYQNDFIELHNTGATEVVLNGWSVQYGSSGGTTWNSRNNLSGTIAPGGYYLIAEGAGAGNGVPLPDAQASGTIAMSATAGKVALVRSTTALTGTGCPLDLGVVEDFVGYGSANCKEGASAAPGLSNTSAAFRKDNGNTDTNENSTDFTTGTPNPRNSFSEPHIGSGGGVDVGPLASVVVTGGESVERERTIGISAVIKDASGVPINDDAATYDWSSTNEAIATVSGNGSSATVTGVAVGGPVEIDVRVVSRGVEKTGSTLVTVIPRVIGHMSIGAEAGMPLVIGYQTRLFINGTDDSGLPFDFNTITYASSNTDVVTVDSRGLVKAVGEGSGDITAMAPDGSSASVTIRTEVPFYADNARQGHNTEFGVPADADPSNDVIIARKQYTLSYNPLRGGPNWVSWDLSNSHLGRSDRCNCYTADTALVRLNLSQYMYTTLDYIGSGYQRGHMEPSADQTRTDGENATTFFLTNFLPQTGALNTGPWEALELDLRDSVRAGREAYVIAGGIFTNGVGLGTLNNAGKIAIPDSTWKIVILMPANTGLGEVTSASDVNVIAVNMPNTATVPSSHWESYLTSIAEIQTSTGYDFLSSLPEAIQCKVEQRNCAPIVNPFAGGTILVGETYSANGSFIDAAADSWSGSSANYGDGSVLPLAISGMNFSLAHTYTHSGTFTVTVTVRDQDGATGSASATVIVQSSLTGVQNLAAMLSSAGLPNANSLQAKLDAAAKQLANGNGTPAANQVEAFANELRAMVISGRLSPSDAAPLLAYAERVIDSIR